MTHLGLKFNFEIIWNAFYQKTLVFQGRVEGNFTRKKVLSYLSLIWRSSGNLITQHSQNVILHKYFAHYPFLHADIFFHKSNASFYRKELWKHKVRLVSSCTLQFSQNRKLIMFWNKLRIYYWTNQTRALHSKTFEKAGRRNSYVYIF